MTYFIEKFEKMSLCQVLSNVYKKMVLNIAAVFPRGSKERKSYNDDKHDHVQEKRRPVTLC